MHDNEEGLCKICESYKNYLQLQEEGYGKEESFHEAVSYMLSEMIEDLMRIGFDEGYNTGYTDSLRTIAKHSSDLADELKKDSCTCDEDSQLELQCGVDCGCYDDECLFEDEDELEDAYECGVDCGCVKQCKEDDTLKLDNKEFLIGEEFVQWLKKKL